MKYCSHCGKEIMNEAVICPHCGCSVPAESINDKSNKGLNIISFIVPIVGAILYLVYHEKEPRKAAALGKWALYGIIASVVLYIIVNMIISSVLSLIY